MSTERSDDREQRLGAHLQRAGELLRSEQVEAADLEVTKALRLAPDDLRARNLQGLVRFRAGRYDEAHSVYTELVAHNPEDAALRLNLGLVELRLGRHAEASLNLRKVVEKEPQNQKAQGYLGLALMRAGDLPGAREAFLAGGQQDFVRQVEDQMASASIVERLPVPPRTEASRALDGELPLESAPVRAGTELSIPRAAISLAGFISSRELKPTAPAEPFTVMGDLLVVRVEGRLPTRTAGAIVSSGRLSYAPVMRRLRGKQSEDTFGEGEDALVMASGSGLIVMSPRAGKFSLLALGDKDVLYVREPLVHAFEETLYWEHGRIPGAGGPAGGIVQFRGQGRVVLRSHKPPWTVRVVGGDVLYIDQESLLGWIGEVVPQQLRGVEGEATQFVAVTGEGALIIDEPASASPPA